MAFRPTILLVPGACTKGSCFDRLIPYLHQAGHETSVVDHPSVDPTNPYAHTAETFALNITSNYLDPLLEAGKDVIVYAYSSGGAKFGYAGPSLVKSAREARGEQGGIVAIVYMSIATVPAGMSQLEFLGGSWPPFVHEDTTTGLLTFDPIIPHLFNDAEPAEQEELAKTVLPHSHQVFTTPVLPPLWADRALDCRRVWLKAMLDATFPPKTAQNFIEATGVPWEVVERDVGHCGFVGHPDVVAGVILDFAKAFV